MSGNLGRGEGAEPLADERKRVLDALEGEALPGAAVFRRIRERSAEGGAEASESAQSGDQSLLYPALHSLEAGWALRAEWVTDAAGRRRRTYRRRRFLPILPSRT